jgi:hypothetical protein
MNASRAPVLDTPRASWGAWLVTHLMRLALLWPLFFLVANPLRLAFIAETFVPFAVVNLLLSLTAASIALAWIDRIRLTGLDIVLLGSLGLTGLATSWSGAPVRDVLVDIVKPVAFVLTIVAIRELADVQQLIYGRGLALRRIVTWIGFTTLAAVVVSHLISRLVLPLYPAYASVDSLLTLAWTATTGASWLTLGYFAVLVASGKRGVYIAALVLLWVTRRHWLRRPQAVTLTVAAIAGAAMVIGPLGPEWITANVLKIHDPSGDVAMQASGFRLAEITGALATMRDPVHWLIGQGFGFAFQAPGFVGYEGEDEVHRNLHFTPLSILVYYGLMFFLPFYAMLGIALARSLRLIRRGGPPAAIGAFYIGSLTFSFTEFSVFVYASFAVSCGLVFAFDRLEAQSAARIDPALQER